MSNREQFDAWGMSDTDLRITLECQTYADIAWMAWQASREALKAEQEYPDKLPCPVLLEPGMRFGKGVQTRSMLGALQRRAEYYAELEEMTPDQRAEQDEAIQELRNMLKPADAWIACSERMPQDVEDADGNAFGSLVLYEAGKEPNGGFNIGVWNNTYLRKWWRGYITHWMPLPAPPSQPHPIDTTSQQYETLAKGE